MRLGAPSSPPAPSTPRAGEVRERDACQRAFARSRSELTVLGDRLAPRRGRPRDRASSSWALAEVDAARARCRAPRAIFGIGLNYADHIRETGGEAARSARSCS